MRLNLHTLAVLTAIMLASFVAKAKEYDSKLNFVENKNQWESVVQYRAELPGGAVFITNQGFTYSFYSVKDLQIAHEKMHQLATLKEVENTPVHGHAYRMNFLGAHTDVYYSVADRRTTYHNYFIGNDPGKWAGKVPLYGKVIQHNVYDGIDVAVYSRGNAMKYDFLLAAGADAGQIQLQFEGVQPQISTKGTLIIHTSVNDIEEDAPYAYQMLNGSEVPVACKYVLLENGVIGFAFPNGYDASLPLVIDPVQVFGTFSGSTGNTYGFSACYDAEGALYAGGESFTTGWPATVGAFQTTFGGGIDCGLNKYSSDGTTLVFATYFGGSGSDLPNNMITNSNNELAVMGTTSSYDLPVSAGCYQSTSGGGNDFHVVHFSADGSAIIGATYVGGSGNDASNYGTSSNYGDQNRGELFFDDDGNILVAGSTSSFDFPVTSNAFQSANAGSQDGVVFKLNTDCSQLLYSTYLGGNMEDACFALVINSDGEVVVCGGTKSSDFPTTPGALHETPLGQTDGFVAILNLSSGLVHSSYLGTENFDHGFKVQVSNADEVLVMGQTGGDYPVSAGVYAIPNGNIFIDKLTSDLSSSIASTRLGTTQYPSGGGFVPTAFLYDYCGNTYLCGFQSSNELPVTPDAFQSSGNGFWFCVLDYGWASLSYASYYGNSDHVDGGSSRFDPNGIIYHSVCTIDAAFPTTPDAYAPNILASGWDVGSFKFDFEPVSIQAGIGIDLLSNDSVCAPGPITFDNLSINGLTYYWDFGDGTTSTEFEPTHIYQNAGTYQVMLAIQNTELCNSHDTAYITVHAFDPVIPDLTVNDTSICNPYQTISLNAQVNNLNEDMSFLWGPAAAIVSDPTAAAVTVNPSVSTDIYLTVTYTLGADICVEEMSDTIHINVVPPEPIHILNPDTLICIGQTVDLQVNGNDHYRYFWSPSEGAQNPESKETSVTPLVNTIYTLVATDSLECSVFDSVLVQVKPCCNMVIANAFSPNGDGKNDLFYLQVQESVIVHQFSIFNRYGQMVFDTVDLSQGWDGNFMGQPADVGVYYYYLKYLCLGSDEEIVQKGDITLLR